MKTLLLTEIRDAMGATSVGELATQKGSGISTDTRSLKPGDVFLAIVGGRFDGHDFVKTALEIGASAAVVSRPMHELPAELRAKLLIVDDTIKAFGRLSAYYRDRLAATVIAVTGSNGKTTTREMIYHILSKHFRGQRSQKSFNNDIGVPITLLNADPADQFLVAEVGTNHPGEIETLAKIVRPDVAVITMVGESHLEGFGDIERVAIEKASLLPYVKTGGAIVVNGDDTRLMRRVQAPAKTSMFRFGANDGNELRLTAVSADGDSVRFTLNNRFEFTLPVPGRHNAMNCAAAIAVARRMGLTNEQIAEDLRDFVMPSMRLQQMTLGSWTVINDAYNANPVSMKAAIATLMDRPTSARRVFFAGDMRELGPKSDEFHRQLGRQVVEAGIDVFVAVGEFCRYAADEALSAGMRAECVRHYDVPAQVGGDLTSIVSANDVILVKGSRSVGMEAVVERLKECASLK